MPEKLAKKCCNEYSFCVVIWVWAVGKQTSNIHLQRTLPHPSRSEQVTQSFHRVAYCSEGLIQLKQGTECDRATNLTIVWQYTTASTVVWSLLHVGNRPQIQTKTGTRQLPRHLCCCAPSQMCPWCGRTTPLHSEATTNICKGWPERWEEEWLSCPYTCRSVS